MDSAPAQRDEILNAATHGLGVILSIGGGSALITLTALQAGAREVVGVSIFVASLVLLFTASTLYHSSRVPASRARYKILDHCAIYILIAGTYTPFMIAVLKGWLGWTLFGVIWGLATVGVVLKLFFTGQFRVLSTVTYVAMGWLGIIAIVPLSRVLTTAALVWLVVGGLIYTAGTIFYHNKRVAYAHAIWHLFVLGGSISHFTAIGVQLLD
jgi:hemolysin III